MKNICLIFSLVASINLGFGQSTGKITYDQLGLSFTIPDGWVGQESGDAFLMGSNTTAGLIILSSHEYSKEELLNEAENGINEGNGTLLNLEGKIELLTKNAIGGQFSGTLEWEAAKAYVIAVPKPFEFNPGVTIMAVTTSALYNETYKKLCVQILNSLTFKKIEKTAVLLEWEQFLTNVKLTFMESYYSGGSTAGGYSKKSTIDLCESGYFNFNSSSSVSVGNAAASAYGSGSGAGDGQWRIFISQTAVPSLLLQFYDGSESYYELKYENEKLYLNGSRYYRTTAGDYAPNCGN